MHHRRSEKDPLIPNGLAATIPAPREPRERLVAPRPDLACHAEEGSRISYAVADQPRELGLIP